MKNTQTPVTTLIAFGDKSGLEYGRSHLFETPVAEATIVAEKIELRDAVIRGLGYTSHLARLGDTDIEITVINKKSD